MHVDDDAATDLAAHDALGDRHGIRQGHRRGEGVEQLAPLPTDTVVACIGPRTAFDARDAGLTVHLIAETRSAESLVEALVEHATKS